MAASDTTWWGLALCRGMNSNIFVPAKDDDRLAAAAKAVCVACAVKSQCLEFALEDSKIEGVWGQTTEKERRKIQRQRRLARVRQEKMDENKFIN